MTFRTLPEDRPAIENKYHDQSAPFDPFSRREYHGKWEFDPATGPDDEGLTSMLREHLCPIMDLPHPVVKAEAVAFCLRHMRIAVNSRDWFPALYTWNRPTWKLLSEPWLRAAYEREGAELTALAAKLDASGAVAIWQDFDHVVPDFASLLSLGFPGVRDRAREYRRKREAKAPLTPEQAAFFDGIEIEYGGVIDLCLRFRQLFAEADFPKAKTAAESMCRIATGAPRTTLDALELMYLYFMVSESVDSYQVRSMGNGFDEALRPFVEADLARGIPRDEIGEWIGYFFLQFSAIGNYWGQPLYLGGHRGDGSLCVSDVSFLVLDVYERLDIYNPKIQIKYAEDTPPAFLDRALGMIRNGHGSIVFCAEDGLRRAMASYGVPMEESIDFDIRGCYETGVRKNEVSTGTGYVNAAKAVDFVLTNGYDTRTGEQIGLRTGELSAFSSFDDVYRAFLLQWKALIDAGMRIANEQYDPCFEEVNPSSLYSATIEHSLEEARDGYAGGVKYNNSALLCCAFASAVDALSAIRYLVYETGKTTLAELRTALDANWQGWDDLRRAALRCPYKYGNGNETADALAEDMSRHFREWVNNVPNARGGVYKAIMHSAREYVWQGERTRATADGRLAGEELSKNGSAVAGMDKNGVTAHLRSALRMCPAGFGESFCVDIVLHPSAVRGEDGLRAMRALLETYRRGGGQSLQFNLFDADALRDAQAHPEKYRNLQVRVCGWNVLWNDLSPSEQEMFLRRAE